MTYVVKLSNRPARYGTVEKLVGRFDRPTRVKRTRETPIGTIREMEETGKVDRSLVRMYYGTRESRDSGGRSANGRTGVDPYNVWFRLLDRHDHIRELDENYVAALAAQDERIAEAEATLKALRQERVEIVKLGWRNGMKLGISEIEEAVT